jgi:hypothetical protein
MGTICVFFCNMCVVVLLVCVCMFVTPSVPAVNEMIDSV